MAPIARALETDVNTLLSFTAVCPPDQLGPLLQELQRQTDGAAALDRLRALVRRWPGDWSLLFQLAGMAVGLSAFNGWPEPERTAARAFAEDALEQVRLHGGEQLRPNAAYTLAALRMETGDLDRAEALLDTLPARTPSPQPLYAALYQRRGERERARTTIRTQLIASTQTLLSLLGMLCSSEYAADEAEADRALEASRVISAALGLSPVSAKTFAITAALRAGRTEEALDALPELAREAVEGPAPRFLWEEPTVEAEAQYHRQMGQALRGGLLTDGDFAPFREDPCYKRALELLESAIG